MFESEWDDGQPVLSADLVPTALHQSIVGHSGVASIPCSRLDMCPAESQAELRDARNEAISLRILWAQHRRAAE